MGPSSSKYIYVDNCMAIEISKSTRGVDTPGGQIASSRCYLSLFPYFRHRNTQLKKNIVVTCKKERPYVRTTDISMTMHIMLEPMNLPR